MNDNSPEPHDASDSHGSLGLGAALGDIEVAVLGEAPSLTRIEVSEQAGVPLEVATELWRLLGFARTADDEIAFTRLDVDALRTTLELVQLGILDPERQSALVRTWGRSYARLAEWQTGLLADVARERFDDPADAFGDLATQVLPKVEALQNFAWRRHLVSAANRLLTQAEAGDGALMAVGFVDIVGYTSRSKALSEAELVDWLEEFESVTTDLVVGHGGRVIKNIGDEVLFVADDPMAAATIAMEMTRRGADEADTFPAVRAGLAFGEVVSRLGDVFGPTVNIAARLTSVARPGTVIIDRGAYEALSGRVHDDTDDGEPEESPAGGAFTFRRLRRVSVKGYPRLPAWSLRVGG